MAGYFNAAAGRVLTHGPCVVRAGGPVQEAKPLDGSPEAAHTAAVVNEVSACIQQVSFGLEIRLVA
jgi:hypothetical protein